MSNKHCLICCAKNETLHWHIDSDTKKIWCWCCKCARGYSIESYCYKAGISLSEYLKGDFEFKASAPNEVNALQWPNSFIPISDPRAKPGVDYLSSRCLTPEGDLFYDIHNSGIVLPLYMGNVFCGAQIRFIEPRITADGDVWKITTMPGTRLGLLIYGLNQQFIMANVKAIAVFEGALNALSVQQSLNKLYGSLVANPFRCVACSGSGGSKHQLEYFKSLKDLGYKIICCSDNDDAGIKMLTKYVEFNTASHYALTDGSSDWNQTLQDMKGDNIAFAKYFLQRIKQCKKE